MKRNDWINNVDGDDIKDAFKNYAEDKVPDNLDQKMQEKINSIEYEHHKQGIWPKYKLKLSLAFSAFLIIIVIPLFLVFGPKDKNILTLAELKNDVVITLKDNIIHLTEGAVLENGTIIETNESSTCNLKFGKKGKIACFNKTKVNISELDDKITTIFLSYGKIGVTENSVLFKGNIEIKTALASIHAIGTVYSIEYQNEILKVKVDEGNVEVNVIEPQKILKVSKNEEVVINKNDIQKYKIISKKWTITPIIKLEEPVIGFTYSKDYRNKVIAVTRHHRLCFNSDGTLCWEEENEREAVSEPLIIENKVYIPASYSIIIADIDTGKLIKNIYLVETMIYQNALVSYKNRLYIPLSRGIYEYDLVSNKYTDHLFEIYGSTTPIIYNDILYSSTYIENSLQAYTIANKKKWVIPLHYYSFTGPLLLSGSLIVATKDGTVMKYSLNGDKLNQTNLKEDDQILSIKASNKSIFVLSYKGILTILDDESFHTKRVFENIVATTYEDDRRYVIAINTNELSIYEETSHEIIKLNNTLSKIIPVLWGAKFFIAFENGEIFIMENK